MDKARIFVAIDIPERATQEIQDSLSEYEGEFISKDVSPSQWRITLVFVENIEGWRQSVEEMSTPLPLAFTPTVILTHLGQGKNAGQIWAFALNTPILRTVRRHLKQRVPGEMTKNFVPHVRVASITKASTVIGVPDSPLRTSFKVKSASIYQSSVLQSDSRYTKVGEIPFTS